MQQSSGLTEGLCGVAYANELFVASGNKCAILTGEDDINWTSQLLATENDFEKAAYGAGSFVIEGMVAYRPIQ
jgi:hypothetical protein